MAYQFANLKREVEKLLDQVMFEIPPSTDGIEVIEHDPQEVEVIIEQVALELPPSTKGIEVVEHASFADQLRYINEQDKGRED